jgi:hypothetical protein
MKATATYYVDCVHGNDHRSGRSAASAWQTLSRVNSVTFRPGNEILLLRGTRCMGMLRPRGSGGPGAPIVISAYGAGPLPIISAGDHPAALELFNQSYWEISNLETMGGTKWGIHIGGDRAYTVLHHFRITNVVVHDVTGTPTNKHTGLIVIEPGGDHMTLDDVVVDGATAYSTTQWAGIMVGFSSGPWYGAAQPLNTNLVVRNSTVHDVAGDGIVIFEARHALTEHNVAYNTGKIVTSRIGTPNAIWDWQCHSCIVQYNEAYHSHSPEKDGGDYDIDYLSQDQTVEYNYGHDSQGYCLAVFGAENSTTTNSVLRYNICANDAQNAAWSYQGDVILETWDGGRIDGVKIYNNTFYWHPAADHALLNNSAEAGTASRVLFENNLIYATVPAMLTTADKSITLDHNLYWYTGKGAPVWTYNGVRYKGFAAYRRGSGQDAHGIYANPDLTSPAYHAVGNPARAFALKAGSPAIDRGADVGHMGGHDFANTPVPHGHGYDIGALESPYARSSGH